MNLFDSIRRACMAVDKRLLDKPAALRQIASLAKHSPLLNAVSEHAILEALEAREALGSTGFNDGIALPHCRIPGLTQFVVGVMSAPNGVDFKSLDGRKTTLFAFMIGPEGDPEDHLRILNAISDTLMIEGAVNTMVDAPNDEALYRTFVGYARQASEQGKKQK